jgi:small neutral amino acid transporter SnatA (MarC family)
MHNQGQPVAFQIIFGMTCLALGMVLVFYTDHYFDWTIRWLQSKAVRLFYRVLGGLLAAGGIAFVVSGFWPR